MLTTPKPSEDLFIYLSVSEHALSAVLLRDQGVQQLVYYVNKTLVDVETRYLPLEKLVLAQCTLRGSCLTIFKLTLSMC